MGLSGKNEIISALKSDILRLQGFTSVRPESGESLLGEIFPGSFLQAAIHEFLTAGPETLAATSGFIAGLLANLMGSHGTVLWISQARTVFPAALVEYGIQPDRCVFIDLNREKEVLWAMDESLKCHSLTAVVAEIKDLNFNQSRRLQLAVEQSKVTGFVIRRNTKLPGTTACVTRWRVTHLPSRPINGMPGIGYHQWKAELLRVRNGTPGIWDVLWEKGKSPELAMKVIKSQAAHVHHSKIAKAG